MLVPTRRICYSCSSCHCFWFSLYFTALILAAVAARKKSSRPAFGIHGVFLVVAACGTTLGRIPDFVYCCVRHGKLILRCTTLCKQIFFLIPKAPVPHRYPKQSLTHSLTLWWKQEDSTIDCTNLDGTQQQTVRC